MTMNVFGHQRRWDSEVCILQAPSRTDLIDRSANMAAVLEATDNVDLKDVAFTLNSEPPPPLGTCLAIVATSVSDLGAKLAEARAKLSDPQCSRIRDHRGIYFFQEPIGRHGKVAFLFPGEGAQYPNMLADVCMQFPDARAWFDLMDHAFIDHERGYLPSELVFTRGNRNDGEDVRIWNMDGAVETVFAANQALLTVLTHLDVRPHMMAGHSSGDYSALLAGGCLAVSGNEQLMQHIRALNTVYEEFSANGELPKTSLLAVGSVDAAVVTRLIDQHAPDIAVALDNCPQQIVLCGTDAAIDRAASQLASDGAISERLPFGRPYHTPLFASFSARLGAFFDRLDIRAPTTEIYSCATAAPYPVDALEVRKLAAAQWMRPVRFRETIEAMYEAGARVFVEVGPRGNLTGFAENTLRGRPALSIATNMLQRSGLTQLNHAIGLLAAQGVPVNTDYLYARRAPRRVALDGSSAGAQTATAASVKLSLRLPRLNLTSAQIEHVWTSSPRSLPIPKSSVLNSSPANSLGSRPAAETRARVMQEYFNSMEQFLRVEREVLQAALARGMRTAAGRTASPVATSPQVTLPLIDRIVSIDPGREAVAICKLDLGEHRYLRDHTLGARVSSFDPDLIGLPVLPLAVSIEILAEVASLLCPGLIAVGARNVRAYRWVVLECECLTLRITAVMEGLHNEIRVEMHEDGSNGSGAMSGRGFLVEATILFADRYPTGEPVDIFPLRDESPSKWPAGDMYGRTGMFHGPAFQLVERIDRFGQDGAEATLVGRGCEAWLGKTSRPAFVMDPMVLDAMGQIVGYWIGDRFERGLSVFPVRLERLELRARALAPGDRARCRVRVTHVSDDAVLSDIDVVAADGTLMVRMHQWEDRRLDLPPRLYDFRIAPHEVLLSDEWPQGMAGIAAAGSARACRLRIPRPLLEAHGEIWLRVVAFLVLGRDERRRWQQLSTVPMQRRLDWLAGRIAAKDSVRLLLGPHLGLIPPCDIEIYGEQNQRPQVRGPWTQTIGRAPHVTIAHSGGEAVAIAIDGEACDGIGVDIERVGRVCEVVRSAALTSEECRWLAAIDEHARPEWTTRVWCAKEAVGKALGCGLPNGGQDLEVCEVDRSRGVLELALRGSLERERADLSGKRIVAYTASEGTLVTAAAIV